MLLKFIYRRFYSEIIMKKKKYFKKIIYTFLIFIIFFLNLISIIHIPSFFIKTNSISKSIYNITSFIPTSSNGPLNKEYFKYYKEITIDHTKVSGTSYHINFPMLISIFDSDLHYHTQADGDDIAFALNEIWLDHEIELFNKNYNSTHAQLVSWVRVTSLSSSIDTNITMYYGNSTMSSRENPADVWSSDYCGVWHLHDNFNDSTSNNNDGTNYESTNTAGFMGDAQNFDGINDRIRIPASQTLNTSSLTASVWIYPKGSATKLGYIVSDYNWDDSPDYKRYAIFLSNGSNQIRGYGFKTDGSNINVVDDSDIGLNQWHFVHLTISSTTISLYLDGSLIQARYDFSGGLQQKGIKPIDIGDEIECGDGSNPFNGIIDEVRISNISHSAYWIATEYNNQHDPNSFYSVGSGQKVDHIAPSWSNLIETDPLDVGEPEVISIDVFDLYGVAQVLFEIENTNYTMVNTGGNTWQNDTWTPSSVGDYDYSIYMQDINDNWNKISDSILVIDPSDITPPTWFNLNETDPLEVGVPELISIDVFDLYGIHQVLFEIENFNYTMINIGGNTWQNDTWIPSSPDDYEYTIYMQDNNNNWNKTTGSIQVIDSAPPTWSNLIESANPLELGNSETITIDVFDANGIAQVFFEIENFNYTMINIGGNTWLNNSWTPSSTDDYEYTIYMQDNSNHWNMTMGSIQVIDSVPPAWSNLIESEDPLELGDTEIIAIEASDISGIYQVLIEINAYNYSMEKVYENSWQYLWTPSTIGIKPYTIYIQDNNSNWNSIGGSILVIESSTPLPNGGPDFTSLLIILGITGGIIGVVIGVIISTRKKSRKQKDKELDTIESIID